jgi:hypothetical protein
MIRIAAQQNNCEKALNTLDEIRYFNLQPDLRSYVGCIYACAQRPDFHTKAFELYVPQHCAA